MPLETGPKLLKLNTRGLIIPVNVPSDRVQKQRSKGGLPSIHASDDASRQLVFRYIPADRQTQLSGIGSMRMHKKQLYRQCHAIHQGYLDLSANVKLNYPNRANTKSPVITIIPGPMSTKQVTFYPYLIIVMSLLHFHNALSFSTQITSHIRTIQPWPAREQGQANWRACRSQCLPRDMMITDHSSAANNTRFLLPFRYQANRSEKWSTEYLRHSLHGHLRQI